MTDFLRIKEGSIEIVMKMDTMEYYCDGKLLTVLGVKGTTDLLGALLRFRHAAEQNMKKDFKKHAKKQEKSVTKKKNVKTTRVRTGTKLPKKGK